MNYNDKQELNKFILDLAVNAQKLAVYFPVDRAFLEPSIQYIGSLNHRDFILYNLELKTDLYTTQLFLCLPEIWEGIEVDDIFEIAKQVSDPTSFNILLKFTYKYLEIDILESLFSMIVKDRSTSFLKDVLGYVKLQYHVFIKSDQELEEYSTDNGYGVDLDKWLYIKQCLLLDDRVRPALDNTTELQLYIKSLLGRIRIDQ